jgi:hypothetical protein
MELETTAQLKLTFNEGEVYELISWLDIAMMVTQAKPYDTVKKLIEGLHGFEDFCNGRRM